MFGDMMSHYRDHVLGIRGNFIMDKMATVKRANGAGYVG